MGFIGRAREIHLLDRSLSDPEPSANIVLGGRGMGKTALLRHVARRHDGLLMAVNRSERVWPYSGLSAFGNAIGGERAAAIDRISKSVDECTDFQIADQVSRALHAIGGEAQTLFIDDIDHMDAASSLALAYVFGRMSGTDLRVVASATRIDARHPFWSLPQMSIGPLSCGEAVALAAESLGPQTARGVHHIVAASTGGNPAAIRRVRLAPHEQSGEAPVPLPVRLRDDAPRRADDERAAASRDPLTNRLLDLVSLAPETARAALIALVPGGEGRIDDLIDDGVLTSRLDDLRLTEPLDRVAIHARMDARERQAAHAALEHAHHGVSPTLERWHASFSDASVDGAALLSAAALRVRAHDTAAAVEFAERALASNVASPHDDAALVALSRELCDHGYFALAELYRSRVAWLDPGDVGVEAAIVSLRVADALDGVVDDAIVDSYVASYSDLDAPGCVRLLDELARIRVRRREYALARARLVSARGLSAAPLTLEHHLMSAIVGLDEPDRHAPGEPGIERFDDLLKDPAAPGAVVELTAAELALLIRYLTMTEQYELSRRRAAFHLERMRRTDPFWEEFVRRLLVENETWAGNATGAREAMAAWERCTLAERRADAARLLTAIGAQMLSADVGLEQLEAMIAEGRALCLQEHNLALTPFYDVMQARCAHADGRFDDAVELFRRAMADVHAPGDPSILRCAPALIESLWILDRRAEAFHALDRFERDARRHPTQWAQRAIARARAVCDTDAGPGSPAADTVASLSTLTEDERAVARLVHRGLRNREIAAELFVSTRTVELRLTRIYRKLEVRSRSHLAAVLVTE